MKNAEITLEESCLPFSTVEEQFAFSQQCLNEYYRPLYSQIKKWLDPHASAAPLLVGISGPQGCGKSSLTATFVEWLKKEGIASTSLSIDDFYLTHSEQQRMAQTKNPLLMQRGYPGTHDVLLGFETLYTLKNTLNHRQIKLPTYDKSCFEGEGDRLPENQWREITTPLKIIFIEGWMLGFTPVTDDKLPNSNFRTINQLLNKYSKWNQLLDAFIHLESGELNWIVDWRIEAEEKRNAQGQSGMSLEKITRYIQLFIPAYEIYVPQLATQPPVRERALHLRLNRDRIAILNKRP